VEPKEAAESLEIIRQARVQTRQAIARSGTGYFFIIWGLVWLLGYLGNQLLGANAGYLWLVLDTFGAVATVLVALRLARRVRGPHGWRMGLVWLAIIGYGVLFFWVVRPSSAERAIVFASLFIAFAYVLVGLWTSPPLTYLGLGLTGLTLVGWFLFPAYLGYWLAFVGGGGMVAVGLLMLRGGK
jgi:hypothetical protein